jgi:hypothetical protein
MFYSHMQTALTMARLAMDLLDQCPTSRHEYGLDHCLCAESPSATGKSRGHTQGYGLRWNGIICIYLYGIVSPIDICGLYLGMELLEDDITLGSGGHRVTNIHLPPTKDCRAANDSVVHLQQPNVQHRTPRHVGARHRDVDADLLPAAVL